MHAWEVRQEVVSGFACRRVVKVGGERAYASFAALKRAVYGTAKKLGLLAVIVEQADIEGEGRYYTLSFGGRGEHSNLCPCDVRLFFRQNGNEGYLFRSNEAYEVATLFVGNTVLGSEMKAGSNEAVTKFVEEVRDCFSKELKEALHELELPVE